MFNSNKVDLEPLENKVSDIEIDLETKADKQETTQRLDDTNGRIDTINTRVDDTNGRIDWVLDNKVTKEDGKGLSSNDYTDEEKSKLDNIDLDLYQTKTDTNLETTSKEIVGAINELKSSSGGGSGGTGSSSASKTYPIPPNMVFGNGHKLINLGTYSPEEQLLVNMQSTGGKIYYKGNVNEYFSISICNNTYKVIDNFIAYLSTEENAKGTTFTLGAIKSTIDGEEKYTYWLNKNTFYYDSLDSNPVTTVVTVNNLSGGEANPLWEVYHPNTIGSVESYEKKGLTNNKPGEILTCYRVDLVKKTITDKVSKTWWNEVDFEKKSSTSKVLIDITLYLGKGVINGGFSLERKNQNGNFVPIGHINQTGAYSHHFNFANFKESPCTNDYGLIPVQFSILDTENVPVAGTATYRLVYNYSENPSPEPIEVRVGTPKAGEEYGQAKSYMTIWEIKDAEYHKTENQFYF